MIDIAPLIYREFGVGSLVSFLLLIMSWFADTSVHPSVRRALAEFLLATPGNARSEVLPEAFLELLNTTFGTHAWSWKFIFRSFGASMLCLVVMFLVFSLISEKTNFSDFFGVLFVGAILNLIPDYVSLVESRFIIRYMIGKRIASAFQLLVVDFVFTTLVISLSFFIFYCIVTLVLPINPISSIQNFWNEYYGLLWNGIKLTGIDAILGIFFLYYVFHLCLGLALFAFGFSSKNKRHNETFTQNISHFKSSIPISRHNRFPSSVVNFDGCRNIAQLSY